MMKKLKFVQLKKDSQEHYDLLESMMIPYNIELDSHHHRKTPKEFIQKITHGMLNMQGASDRHLEFCYDKDSLIGFLYGKVDHEGHKGFIKPEYGYIMEFYVKPEFRRMGYGKAMFHRLERLFASHGTRKMYLTADPVTGKPFWEVLGFIATGNESPENGQMIYEKEVENPKEIISIAISDFLSLKLVDKIAFMQWHSSEPSFLNSIKHMIYDGKTHSDCFNVVASNAVGEVVGRLFCLKNQQNPHLWYYGDLAVCHDYRRQHIARKMLQVAIEALQSRGCTALRTYVEPGNLPSLNLQATFGFIEKPYETFDNLINEGQIMFEKELSQLSILPATVHDARFITMIYGKNVDALHGSVIMFDEWKRLLSENDPDEAHFIIHKGAMPCGWLKINGLQNADMAWISMLAIEPKMQHQGIGTYAVKCAEDFIHTKGFTKIGIHTTEDNIPAQNLYKKCGYVVTEYSECTTGDGTTHMGYTFEKSF
ncbi:MAG: GNAT family N-acetyltransferase [Eubacteriales bacterium]|nr:GNAT family N-acetyltransferase [Eubacteriales bacterium]